MILKGLLGYLNSAWIRWMSRKSDPPPLQLTSETLRKPKMFRFKDRYSNDTHRRVWSRGEYAPREGWPVPYESRTRQNTRGFEVRYAPPEGFERSFKLKSLKFKHAMTPPMSSAVHFQDNWVGIPTKIAPALCKVEPEAVVQLRQRSPYSVSPPTVKLHKIPIPNRAKAYSPEWVDEMKMSLKVVNPDSPLLQETVSRSTLYMNTVFETPGEDTMRPIFERGVAKSTSRFRGEGESESYNDEMVSIKRKAVSAGSSSSSLRETWKYLRASSILKDSALPYRQVNDQTYYDTLHSSNTPVKFTTSKPKARHYELHYSWVPKVCLSPALSSGFQTLKITPFEPEPFDVTSEPRLENSSRLVLSDLFLPQQSTTPIVNENSEPFLLDAEKYDIMGEPSINLENATTWKFEPRSGVIEVPAEYDPDDPFPHPFPWLPPCS